MRLPHVERAVVTRSKLLTYLLNRDHPAGWSKANFFARFGYDPANWELLEQDLIRHAQENEVASVADTRFGTRYSVEGSLLTPTDQEPLIRSVWFVDTTSEVPRLITAYPLSRSRR